ncbi:MAG: selenium metabolism-associated LysR family transcriptional regulator [Bacillota bacterium]
MNLRQLEVFLRVAELKSFTRAARQLYMSQPAVSFQIRSLEEELGVKLFWRNEKNVMLTEAGRLLYPEVKQMIGHFYKIKSGLDNLKGLRTGHLEIGASTIPGEYLLPLLIGDFRKKYPGVLVSLRIGGSGEVEKWLANREIDLGFTGIFVAGKEVECLPWIDDRLVLIIPPDHPWGQKKVVDVSELIKEPLILREPGSGTRRAFEDRLAAKNVLLTRGNTAMELGSTRAIITAVQAGLGIGVVSYWAAREPLLLNRVKEILLKDVDLRRKLYVARSQNRLSNYATDVFYNFTFNEDTRRRFNVN